MINETPPHLDDIVPDDLYHALLLRSSIRRGEIMGIKLPHIPADYTVVQAADIPGAATIRIEDAEIPLLARTHVSYRGEPILVVVGPDYSMCDRIRSQIEVTYDRAAPARLEDVDARVAAERSLEQGDLRSTFADAFQITEGEYRFDQGGANLLEMIGAVCKIETEGVSIWSPSRWLFHVRSSVASCLGRDESEITAYLCSIDSSSDGYVWRPSLLSAIAATSASACGHSVKIVAEPSEVDASPTGPTAMVLVKSAIDRSGNLIGLDMSIVASTGAHAIFGREFLDRICIGLRDSNQCENIRIRGRLIETSETPAELYVGFGDSVSNFAMEIHFARIAELAGGDPAEWRRRHLTVSRDHDYDLLDKTTIRSDFTRKFGAYEMQRKRRGAIDSHDLPLRGIGIARAVNCAGSLGPIKSQLDLSLDSEGQASLSTSVQVDGIGSSPLRKIVAEVLSLDSESIRIVEQNTNSVPDSGPSIFGRDLAINAKLARQCAEELNRRRFREPLPIVATRSSRRKRQNQWNPVTLDGNPCIAQASAVMAIEVEVDPVALQLGIKGVWVTVAAGNIVDQHTARIEFTAEMARAFETVRNYEQRWEEAGWDLSAGRMDRTGSVPPVFLTFLEGAGEESRPIGGLAVSLFLPAFVSAISQATGFYFDTMPLADELIHRYVDE